MIRSLPAFSLLLLFALHVVVWTLYGMIYNPGAIHHDMMEAYLWGHEYQLGYFKHPPFWAWLAGAWFEVFPRSNWAFYLLASSNSGFALLGVWRLYGLYAKGDLRQASLLLLLATPLYTFLALKFNANAMLLALWPWTVYFFSKSIEKPSLRSAVLFGAFAAASMLSKYYSALLLVSLFAASLVHPNAKRYYRSPAPYLTVMVFAVLVSPHIYWATEHGFQTVKYAQTRAGFSGETVYRSVLTFILGCIAFHAVVLAINLLSKPFSCRTLLHDEGRRRFLLIMAFGPFLLSVLSGLISHVRLSTNFAIPIFFLVPLALALLIRPDTSRLRRLALGFAIVIYALALPIAVAVPFLMIQQKKKEFLAPVLEVAEMAKQRWAETTNAPVRTVAGALPYAMAAAFYDKGEVREFTGFDFDLAPWVTPQSIIQGGLLAICFEGDAACTNRAADFMTPQSRRDTITASRHYGSFTGPPQRFELLIIPPR